MNNKRIALKSTESEKYTKTTRHLAFLAKMDRGVVERAVRID